jgi:hypothetical protein
LEAEAQPVSNSLHLVQANAALSLLLFVSGLLLVVASLRIGGAYRQRLATARRAHQREHETAEQRAAALLWAHLSESQAQQLLTHGYLEIPSQSHPGRTYRIPARPGQVAVYEAGGWVGQLCLVTWDPAPYADLILAQKWLMEADEPAYLALANWIDGAPLSRARRTDERQAQLLY